MESLAVTKQSQQSDLSSAISPKRDSPFKAIRVGVKNLGEFARNLFEKGCDPKSIKAASSYVQEHKRAVALVGAGALVLLAPNQAEAVLLVNNGVFNDAIGGSIIRSSGISNAVRTADSFTVTGAGDTDLVRYSIAGTSRLPGSGNVQGDISQLIFTVCLYGESNRWNAPIFQSQLTPSNSDYLTPIGLTVNGLSVHKFNFNLSQFSQLQHLSAGQYKISIHGQGNGNQSGGDFQRITSTPGVGTVGNSFYDGVGISGWTPTTSGGGVYANSAINGQLEAVPEPGSIAALSIGAASLLLRRRKKD